MGQTFSASGPWVCPAGVTSISIECWAAGAGSGTGSASNGGGGGGGGAYSKKNAFTVVPTTSYNVVVGPGGLGLGGDSTFNATTCVAKGGTAGGNGGVGSNGTAGVGGASASGTGDVKFSGGNGVAGQTASGGGGGGGAGDGAVGSPGVTTTGGNGGATGGGKGGNGGAAAAAGVAGLTLGGGGGGGGSVSGAAAVGARGEVRLHYLYDQPGTTALTLAAAIGSKGITLAVKVAALTLAAVATRTITTARAYTVALSLGTALARTVALAPKVAALTLTARGRVDMALTVLNRITGGGGGPSFSIGDAARHIAGVIRASLGGTPVAGASVRLIRESDNFVAATTTSDAGGEYEFAFDTAEADTFSVVVYDGATGGVSRRGVSPS